MESTVKKESVEHGTIPFHFAVYRHDSEYYGFGFSPHWHEEYEIIYVKEGLFHFLINGQKFCVKKGQALFIDRYALHAAGEYTGNADSSYVCYVFGKNFIFPDYSSYICKQFYSAVDLERFTLSQLITSETSSGRKILSQIGSLDQLSHHPENNALSLQICLLTIFEVLLKEKRYFPVENRLLSQNEIVRSALICIHEEYPGRISVESLASSLHLSTNHFIRVFRSMTGITPQKYIQKFRIKNALSLIDSYAGKSAPVSVSEIASMVGYDDVNYFSRVFKKETGQTPGSYERKISRLTGAVCSKS